MRKSTTTTSKSSGWLSNEQLPLDTFFTSKAPTSRSQDATHNKGKRRKSARGGEDKTAKKPRLSIDETPSREAIHRGAKQIPSEASNSEALKEKRRKSLDDITTRSNIADEGRSDDARMVEQPYPTPSESKRCRSVKEVTEIPESSDDARFNSDPMLEPTPCKAPTGGPVYSRHLSKDRLSLFCSTSKPRASARIGTPSKSKAGKREVTEVPESSDDTRPDSDSLSSLAPHRTPATRPHAEDALPTPPASSIPTQNRPTVSHLSDCGTPLPHAEVSKLRFRSDIAMETPMLPPTSRANAYPTPESLAIPRFAFPKIQQVLFKRTDGDFKIPPSSPIMEPGNQSVRRLTLHGVTQPPVVKVPAFTRPSTPDHTWEVLSSQSQHPVYSPRKPKRPAPLFIEGSSSSRLVTMADRDFSIPTSQEEEDEMIWEKVPSSRTLPLEAQDGPEETKHTSMFESAGSELVHIHDARHFSATIIGFPGKHVLSKAECKPSYPQRSDETQGHRNCISKIPSRSNVLGDRSSSSARSTVSAEESTLNLDKQFDSGASSATDVEALDRRNQRTDTDIPSSMTIPESWDDNPFPSLVDIVLDQDDVGFQNSAYHHQSGRHELLKRALNSFRSCTQSSAASATQVDSDDDDPFPDLPVSTVEAANSTVNQLRRIAGSSSPVQHGKEVVDIKERPTMVFQDMPDIGSLDDSFSVSMLTPRKVTAVLRTAVGRIGNPRISGHPLPMRVGDACETLTTSTSLTGFLELCGEDLDTSESLL